MGCSQSKKSSITIPKNSGTGKTDEVKEEPVDPIDANKQKAEDASQAPKSENPELDHQNGPKIEGDGKMIEPAQSDTPIEEETLPPPPSIKKDITKRIKKYIDFHPNAN